MKQLEFIFPDYEKIHNDILSELDDKILILKWLINGQGRLGIPISYFPLITKEWIIKNYNVEPSYFNHI